MEDGLLKFKIDTDCGEIGLLERIIGESSQQRRFTNTAIADKDDLILIIMSHAQDLYDGK